MSELRDLTQVFRAIQASLRDIGKHVAAQDANGEQLRLKLHDLSNAIQTRDLAIDEHFIEANALMKTFAVKQDELSQAIGNLQTNLSDHRREIGKRIRKFEDADEVTQS